MSVLDPQNIIIGLASTLATVAGSYAAYLQNDNNRLRAARDLEINKCDEKIKELDEKWERKFKEVEAHYNQMRAYNSRIMNVNVQLATGVKYSTFIPVDDQLKIFANRILDEIDTQKRITDYET